MAKLDERTRELIAVGAAITANCLPCLEYHVGKARESGAATDEIREAVDMGRMVRKGAAAKVDRLSAILTTAEPGVAAASATATPPTEGCGCA